MREKQQFYINCKWFIFTLLYPEKMKTNLIYIQGDQYLALQLQITVFGKWYVQLE